MKTRPSAWWYLLVIPIIGLGITIAVFQTIDEVQKVQDSFVRLGSDGDGHVTGKQGDQLTVWAARTDLQSGSQAKRPEAEVVITGPGGEPVPFQQAGPQSSFTFTTDELSAIDLGTFTPPTDGRYEVRVTYAEDLGDTRNTVIGHLDIFAAIGRVTSTLGWAFGAAIGWALLLTVLRIRSARRNKQVVRVETTLGAPSSPVQSPPAPPATDQRGPFS